MTRRVRQNIQNIMELGLSDSRNARTQSSGNLLLKPVQQEVGFTVLAIIYSISSI
jgi:hypothetical protein